MVISSLVVEAAPDCTEAVAAKLPDFEGVEVHDIQGHKLVITIERETVDQSHATANALLQIEGVLNVNLIYLNFEDDPTIYPDGI